MMKRNDLILMAVVLAAAGLWWGLTRWRGSEEAASQVKVWQDKALVGTYALRGADAVRLPVDTAAGHNVVVIENGAVRVAEADCPDQVCVHTGAISGPGETIVCLPNRLLIEITGEPEGEVEIDDLSQ